MKLTKPHHFAGMPDDNIYFGGEFMPNNSKWDGLTITYGHEDIAKWRSNLWSAIEQPKPKVELTAEMLDETLAELYRLYNKYDGHKNWNLIGRLRALKEQ